MRLSASRGTDRGSALMLMPAGVLVVLILASIAVDMSVVHLRKRQALDLAAGAANDAATAAADPGSLRTGDFRLDPARAREVVDRVVAATDLAADPVVVVTDDGVEVTLAVAADYVFAAAIPGAPDGAVVTATAAASAAAP
jgi:hypothetical protein